MNILHRRTLAVSVLALSAAILSVLCPHQVLAQQNEQPLPSYARPGYATTEQTIKGRVTVINGTYMEIADTNGYIDRVELHQGTIINPTGIRLEPGMTVTIIGHASGNKFLANEIDTPYHYSAYAPYPYYPYPYYGPPVYLGIGFGYHHGWWR